MGASLKTNYASQIPTFDKKKLYSEYKPWKEHCKKNQETSFTIYYFDKGDSTTLFYLQDLV